MTSFAVWLKSTPISELIRYYPWLWPICETIHFVGLALVIGIAGLFDLRLMGFMRRISISAAKDLMPFAIAGFAMNLVTGTIFFVGAPNKYATIPLVGQGLLHRPGRPERDVFRDHPWRTGVDDGAGRANADLIQDCGRRVAPLVARGVVSGTNAAVYRRRVLNLAFQKGFRYNFCVPQRVSS